MYELITKLLILSLIVYMMISYSYCVELCHLKGFLCLLGSFHIYVFIIPKILYMCHVFMVDSLIISVEGKQKKRVFFNIKVYIINLNKKCNFNNLIPWCPTLNVFYLYMYMFHSPTPHFVFTHHYHHNTFIQYVPSKTTTKYKER